MATPQGPKFGYLVCQQSDSAGVGRIVREVIEEARFAEEVGFDGVFVSEHHQRTDNYIPAPTILAGLLAHETRHVDIGIGVAILPLYHPVKLAEDAALVDAMSGGRLILGLGAGYMQPDVEGFGVVRKSLPRLMDEGIEIVIRSWTEDGWNFQGSRWTLHGMHVTPKPVQKPRPRLWIGASSNAGVLRAARFGDGWIIGARPRREVAQRWVEVYRQACSARGIPPYAAVIRDAWVASSHREIEEEFGRYALASVVEKMRSGYLEPLPRMQDTSAEEVSYDAVRRDRWLVGHAEDIQEQIDMWRTLVGVNYFVLRFRHAAGPEHRHVLGQIERFADKVMRPLKAAQ